MNDLERAVQQWDGQSVADLQTVYRQYHRDDDFLTTNIQLLPDSATQIAASWLIKKTLCDNGPISSQLSGKLLKLLPQLQYWQARLHILQCFSALPISEKDKPSVETFLQRCLNANNKFVRAWAYHGFAVLAKRFPEYRAEVDEYFTMALRDEPASVKARVRNILKTWSAADEA